MLVVLIQVGNAEATSPGITGYSGNPAINGGATCASCHTGGATPTVSLLGPSMVDAGSTNTFTLVISGGPGAGGGLDLSATAGTLIAGAGLQLIGAELAHTAPRPGDGSGSVSWSFAWTAPDTSGPVTLYGAGNSVDLDGTSAGDGVAVTQLLVDVTPSANQPPVSKVGGPYGGEPQAPIVFDGSGSYDSDGLVTEYAWDFGDGSTAKGGAGFDLPGHSYVAAGDYTATLVVTDDAGATDTSSTTVTIGAGVIVTTTTTTTTTTTPTAPAQVSGSAVYRAQCAICHGSSGQGGSGPELQSISRGWVQIRSITADGRGSMPSFAAKLSDAQLEAVARYTRGLQGSTDQVATERTTNLSPDASPADLFAAECASCHGPAGEGGSGPRVAERTYSPEFLVSVITKGDDDMPGFGGLLTADQIAELAGFTIELGVPDVAVLDIDELTLLHAWPAESTESTEPAAADADDADNSSKSVAANNRVGQDQTRFDQREWSDAGIAVLFGLIGGALSFGMLQGGVLVYHRRHADRANSSTRPINGNSDQGSST